MGKKFQYIYGPVYSWRLGRSLGIDLVFDKKKRCNFDCVYCQLGKTFTYTNKRKIFVPTDKIKEELKRLPKLKIDYITFSGSGEPTLAKNLKDIVYFIKENFKIPVAILTNASLLDNPQVKKDLLLFDFVCLKLDAKDTIKFKKVNRPYKKLDFNKIIDAILDFKKIYKKRLALQIMFVEENKTDASEIAELAYKIMPEEIQINTPLRPSKVKPLNKDDILKIKDIFLKKFASTKVKIISVYDKLMKKKIRPLSEEQTFLRRPDK